MKIVVLDGYALNTGDLSWDPLKALGELEVYDRTPPALTLERAKGAEILLTNKTLLTQEIIGSLPGLKYIGVLATGYNVVDIQAAARAGVVVTNIPAYSTDSVAQMVFALLLELCLHVGMHDQAVHSGEWAGNPDFSFRKTPLVELSGKTMGIIGFGRIGRQTARIAGAMGMKVAAASRLRLEAPPLTDFRWLDIPDLLAASDVVSLSCPLTPETKGLINRETIGLMKKTAYLINTSRGPVINDYDLVEALNSGRIAGAGIDVMTEEPPREDTPLLGAKNCIITPHMAWATKEARVRLMEKAVENVRGFLTGKPVNIVEK